MKRKKVIAILSAAILAMSLFAGCTRPGLEQQESAIEYLEASVQAEQQKESAAQQNPHPIVQPTSPASSEAASEEKASDAASPEYDGKTPFEAHGKLKLDGCKIVDESGNPFQLCGVSTHGIGWFPEYINKESFTSLRDDWGANVVRLAMYTAEGAGYCTGGNRDDLKKLVTNGVDYATELGMYVIVDWHILHDLDPNVYKSDAIAFFDEMSKKYKDQDNVLYEICNEPNGGTNWAQVKSYALEVIPVIRANDPDAIIIVGTPTWSQDVDAAAADKITGYDNIMYALHFYAATHKDDLRNKMENAIKADLPIFITEFSICEASGNGFNDTEQADKWISLADKYGVSFVAWNLSNKAESSSLIQSGCTKTSGWSYDELSDSGKWLVSTLSTHTAAKNSFFTGAEGESRKQEVSEIATANVSEGSIGDCKATVTAANSWDSGNSKCTQYNVSIQNSGAGAVSGWTIEIDFKQAVTVDQIWCAKASVNGNVVTITPESFNSIINGKTTVSDIGFIISASGQPDKPTVTMK